ncbi:MAG: hypothetical protein R8K46_10900, partial [Mariprofundaceae bacterium]
MRVGHTVALVAMVGCRRVQQERWGEGLMEEAMRLRGALAQVKWAAFPPRLAEVVLVLFLAWLTAGVLTGKKGSDAPTGIGLVERLNHETPV